MNTHKIFFSNNYKLFSKPLTVLLIATCFYISFLPQNALAFVLSSSETAGGIHIPDESFDKIFREGRDLIDKGDWTKAAEKFNEVVNKYPDNKSTDAALYWLAFCYKKQRDFKQVGATVDRLIKDFPSSSWTSDAKVLLIETSSQSQATWTIAQGTVLSPTAVNSRSVAATGNARSVSRQVNSAKTLANNDVYALLYDAYVIDAKTSLDRQDEIKLAAFQSLFAADTDKGIQAMNDLLKPDSKASTVLKIQILRSLRRTSLYRAYSTFESAKPVAVKTTEKPQFSDNLRESLIKIFQNESNLEIRKEIIYILASQRTSQSTDYLTGLYRSENNTEIKKAIISGLGSVSSTNTNIFFTADASAPDSTVLAAVPNNQTAPPVEFNKLLEIFRTENDPELRLLAFNNLQRFRGWENINQISELLIQTYDSQTNENVKSLIIYNLLRTKQPQALRKVLDIAKNDKSDRLRLIAIRALGTSKDPEAVKYLEEILK